MTKKKKFSFLSDIETFNLKKHQDETDKSDSILANNKDKFYH